MRLNSSTRIPKEGVNQVSERTDSEYEQKTLAKLSEDYRSCPTKWKKTFWNGLDKRTRDALEEMGHNAP